MRSEEVLLALGLYTIEHILLSYGSTPAPGTKGRASNDGLSLPFEMIASRLSSVESSVMYPDIKYKKARLVIPGPTAKVQNMYIKVYALDFISGKQKLKRIYDIGGDNLKEKIINANLQIEHINEALATGSMFGRLPKNNEATAVTLQEVILFYKAARKHTRSYGRRLDSYINPYYRFCEKEKMLNKDIRSITKLHALRFDMHLKSKGYANRTINDHMSYAKSIWNEVLRNHEHINKSPFRNIRALPKGTGKNLAYQPEQILKIMEQHKLYPDLDLLAKFMYYSLARTNELSLLQVKHIGLYNANQIYVPKENSKNGFERHINIPSPLEDLIRKHKLRDLNPEWYIFSFTTKSVYGYKPVIPQPHTVPTNRLGEKYGNMILRKMKFPKEYTLYSWKHTGVISAHNAGVPDSDIMQQTGHRNFDSFNTYMKSLGLMAKGQYAVKIPEI